MPLYAVMIIKLGFFDKDHNLGVIFFARGCAVKVSKTDLALKNLLGFNDDGGSGFGYP